MRRFLLFKTLTAVLGSVLLLSLFSPGEIALGEGSSRCSREDIRGIAMDYLGLTTVEQFQALEQSQRAEAMERAGAFCNGTASVENNNTESCRDANREMGEAIEEFNMACSVAGLGDSISCGERVRDCLNAPALQSGTSPSLNGNDIVGNINSAMQGQTVQQQRSVTPSLESARDRFDHCPLYASEDLENWQEAVQGSQDRVNDLQNQISEMQTEMVELQTEKATKLKEIKDNVISTQEQAEDDAEQIRLELQEFDENLVQQVQRLEEAITEQNNRIGALGDTKVSAYNALMEAQTRLNLQCHAAALAKVEQLRQQKQALIGQSLYSAGGFNNLLQSVGLTNAEAAEALATQIYNECIEDRAYTANLAVAERAYRQAVHNSDRAISAANNRIQQIQDQIHRVQGELRLKGLDNFSRRLERLERRMITRIQQLQEDYVIQSQNFDAQLANKQQQIMQAQMQLSQAQDFLNQRQAYYDVKNQSSGGRNISREDVDSLFAKYSGLRVAARAAVDACGNGINPRVCNSAMDHLSVVSDGIEDSACEATITTTSSDPAAPDGTNGSGTADLLDRSE